jgi:hypothetical protein
LLAAGDTSLLLYLALRPRDRHPFSLIFHASSLAETSQEQAPQSGDHPLTQLAGVEISASSEELDAQQTKRQRKKALAPDSLIVQFKVLETGARVVML